jgi:hypothetical protein
MGAVRDLVAVGRVVASLLRGLVAVGALVASLLAASLRLAAPSYGSGFLLTEGELGGVMLSAGCCL